MRLRRHGANSPGRSTRVVGESMSTEQLIAERDAILARLEIRWAWCAANPTHPKHVEREVACLLDLRAYERAEDRLRQASEWEDVAR